MFKGAYMKRGILCIIIGIIYLAIAYLYYYYYKKNEIVNKDNYMKQKIYGPNIFFILQIAVYFVSIILYLFLSYAYFRAWLHSAKSSKFLKESCDNYRTVTDVVLEKVNPLK